MGTLFQYLSVIRFLSLLLMRIIRLNNGKDDPELARMAIHFPLVLANFGAGEASLKAVYDGLFKRVILDKGFIQQHAAALLSPLCVLFCGK